MNTRNVGLMVLVSLILILGKVSGQIIYHEFNPIIDYKLEEIYGDSTCYTYLDLNMDSVDDVMLRLSYYYCFVTPYFDECFFTSISSPNENAKFISTSSFPFQFCDVRGLFPGDTIWHCSEYIDWGWGMVVNPEGYDKCTNFSSLLYAGVKLINEVDTFYGWIKLQTGFYITGDIFGNSYAELHISEYAFNTQAGCGLIAGDTTTSLCNPTYSEELNENQITLFPVPAKDQFYINNLPAATKITITDIFGNTIYNKLSGGEMEEIECKKFAKGMYFILLEFRNNQFTRKLIVAE